MNYLNPAAPVLIETLPYNPPVFKDTELQDLKGSVKGDFILTEDLKVRDYLKSLCTVWFFGVVDVVFRVSLFFLKPLYFERSNFASSDGRAKKYIKYMMANPSHIHIPLPSADPVQLHQDEWFEN